MTRQHLFLTDRDPMPFGKYEGERMENVPAAYLDWLRDQKWLKEWPAVEEYIRRNKKEIDFELKEEKQYEKERE